MHSYIEASLAQYVDTFTSGSVEGSMSLLGWSAPLIRADYGNVGITYRGTASGHHESYSVQGQATPWILTYERNGSGWDCRISGQVDNKPYHQCFSASSLLKGRWVCYQDILNKVGTLKKVGECWVDENQNRWDRDEYSYSKALESRDTFA